MLRGRNKKSLFWKLWKIGWQSWSVSGKKWLLSINCLYPPSIKFNFPKLNFKKIKLKKPAYGWCSWYAFGRNINETNILRQTNWLSKRKNQKLLPIEYVLIDDGWCDWGDWLIVNKNKFPNGLKKVSQKIKKTGMKPGVWIAPFLVDPKSTIVTTRPDWLAKNNGMLVEGLNMTKWDRFFPYKKWILDIRNDKVQEYFDRCLKFLIVDCGFELIKLDFLYSIYFIPGISFGEAHSYLRKYLKKIKKEYPNVYTIASGCPFLPAVGVVDSMRVGPDTSISPFVKFMIPNIISNWYLKWKVIPAITKRLWTKKFWNIDPDVYICRKNFGFSTKLLKSFQRIIKSGEGNIFLGDDLTVLPSKKIKKYLAPLFKRN